MADYVSAGVVLEVLCYSLVRFPLICGAGLCSIAMGIWLRAEFLDEIAHTIINTPLQSLSDAVDALRKQVVESDGTSSAAFVVTRGVIVPAGTTVVQSDLLSSSSAVYMGTEISSTPLLASGFMGLVDHDPIVRSKYQLVGLLLYPEHERTLYLVRCALLADTTKALSCLVRRAWPQVSFMLRDGGEAVRVNHSRLQCAFRTVVSRMEVSVPLPPYRLSDAVLHVLHSATLPPCVFVTHDSVVKSCSV
jgi:hypothetical protein